MWRVRVLANAYNQTTLNKDRCTCRKLRYVNLYTTKTNYSPADLLLPNHSLVMTPGQHPNLIDLTVPEIVDLTLPDGDSLPVIHTPQARIWDNDQLHTVAEVFYQFLPNTMESVEIAAKARLICRSFIAITACICADRRLHSMMQCNIVQFASNRFS